MPCLALFCIFLDLPVCSICFFPCLSKLFSCIVQLPACFYGSFSAFKSFSELIYLQHDLFLLFKRHALRFYFKLKGVYLPPYLIRVYPCVAFIFYIITGLKLLFQYSREFLDFLIILFSFFFQLFYLPGECIPFFFELFYLRYKADNLLRILVFLLEHALFLIVKSV